MNLGRETFPYRIDWARPQDWSPAMQMVWRTFLQFEAGDYTEEGICNFLDFITDHKMYRSFLQGEYRMLIAWDGDRIIGVASVRNGNHLSLLFVDERYHMQGIGRTLMELICECLRREGEGHVSLTAAPYAVGFYCKLGFHIVKPEEEIHGIRITSMEKKF